MDPERQPLPDLVEELDGAELITYIVDLQRPDAGAIVDCRELVEPLSGSGNALQGLDVHLQAVAGLRTASRYGKASGCT